MSMPGQLTKYRITVKRPSKKLDEEWELLPHTQDFADIRDDALIKAHTLQMNHPDDLVEIVLNKSFRQGGAMRWKYDITLHTLETVQKFDRSQGTGDLLAAI